MLGCFFGGGGGGGGGGGVGALIPGQTDSLTVGHDEGIMRVSQLCERA